MAKDANAKTANFVSKWFYNQPFLSKVIEKRLEESNLVRRPSSNGYEDFDIPEGIHKLLNDINMSTEGMDMTFIKRRLALARQDDYKGYKDFKEALRQLYAEPR